MKKTLKLNQIIKLSQLLFVSFSFFSSQPVLAQTSSLKKSCEIAFNSNLKAGDQIITAETISLNGLTTPSLWWAKQQFDPFDGKLLINWIVNQETRRIDLLVNRQLWTLLDYLGRYYFMNDFGAIAREYEYNLRIVTEQEQCLATYNCNYQLTPYQCEIDFDPSLQNDLQRERNSQL